MKYLLYLFIFIATIQVNLFANNYLNIIEEKKLYDSKIWKSLIHFNNDKASINDNKFLLSYNDFSPKNELISTLHKFKKNNSYICKFPARYEFIKNNIPNYKIKKPKCKELNKYLELTNLESLDLVFVSENIKSPSSMMGHVFFKLNSYKDTKSNRKINAISFYTILQSLNLPVIIYESTIKGMKGYFVLKPYKKQIFTYTNIEERNVWEYNLKLSEENKKLIYYHFWELKDIDITYYFTKFNCATLVDEILSITYKENVKNKTDFWTTPLDVVKKANYNRIIKNGTMIPSLEWNLYMLEKKIDEKAKDRLLKLINEDNYPKLKYLYESNSITFLEKKLVYYYVRYKYLKLRNMNLSSYKKYIQLFKKKEEYDIDVSSYKNPLYRNNESQLSISYNKDSNKDNSKELSILLAGNTIMDYDRTSFGENVLQIGKISLELDDNISLKEIVFYNMKSYLPMTSIQKVVSKEIDISYSEKENFKVSAGLGASFLLHNDVLNYNMIEIGLNSSKGDLATFIKPKIGYTIHEIFNLKTIMELNHSFYSNKNNEDLSKFSLTQSYTKKDLFRIDMSFNKILNHNNDRMIFNFTYFF